MRSTLSPFQKLIHILLIVYAGFIGPLSYFNFYSPHRVSNSYHLSILEDPSRISELASIKRMMSRDKNPLSISQLTTPGPALSDHALAFNFSQNLQDVLGYVYTAIEGMSAHLQQCLFCQMLAHDPIAKSTYLAIPEKPPKSTPFL